MRVTMAQLDPTIGDYAGNLAGGARALAACASEEPDLVVFPELYLTGYPPRDLLERGWFIAQAQDALQQLLALSQQFPRTGILVGLPRQSNLIAGKGLFNSAVLLCNGEVLFQQNKSLLPTYDIFDEARWFDPAPRISVVPFQGEVLGISICEDAWNDPELWLRVPYALDPIAVLAEAGATLLLNISASPFWTGKEEIRYRLLSNHARRHHVPMIFVNQVGANDELIFDGRSLFLDSAGCPVRVFPAFAEHIETVDSSATGNGKAYEPETQIESIYDGLLLGNPRLHAQDRIQPGGARPFWWDRLSIDLCFGGGRVG